MIVLAAGFLEIQPRAFGQHVSFGIAGGVSLTDAFPTQTHPYGPDQIHYYSDAKDYLVGPTLELALPLHLSVEVDALFRSLHSAFASVSPSGSTNTVSTSSVVTWEFPVLAKYRFGPTSAKSFPKPFIPKPFIEAGPSFRTAGNLNVSNPSHVGITAGVGVEMHLRGLTIAPAFRYTRWAADDIKPGPSTTKPNQVEFLTGFSHTPESDWHPLGRHFSIGVMAGASLTDDFRSETSSFIGGSEQEISSNGSGPKSFLVGPMIELDLPKSFSVEVNALYRPMRSAGTDTITFNNQTIVISSTFTYVTWNFPVLAKYKLFERSSLKPFVELGPSFRLTQGLYGASPFGVTAGVGVETHYRRLKIAPAVRYTHWAPDNPPGRSGAIQNQAEFLTGFSF